MNLRTFASTLICLTVLSGCATSTTTRKITVDQLAKTTRSWNGATLPHYPTGQPEVTILKITIPPGQKLPMHKHPVINAGVLLEGELTVRTESGQVQKMKAGDSLIELVDTWHFGENPGRSPAVILVVYAGTVGRPITERKSGISTF